MVQKNVLYQIQYQCKIPSALTFACKITPSIGLHSSHAPQSDDRTLRTDFLNFCVAIHEKREWASQTRQEANVAWLLTGPLKMIQMLRVILWGCDWAVYWSGGAQD